MNQLLKHEEKAPRIPRTVAEIMTREVFAVAPETNLVTAARLLFNRHIGGAPVVDPAGRPVGVVTLSDLVDPDRDHTRRLGRSYFYLLGKRTETVYAEQPVSPGGMVADVMSPFILSISPQASIRDAAALMLADDVHRVLVVDQGRLVGIISTMDILRAVIQDS